MNFDVANATIVVLHDFEQSHVTPFARALSALLPLKYRSKLEHSSHRKNATPDTREQEQSHWHAGSGRYAGSRRQTL